MHEKIFIRASEKLSFVNYIDELIKTGEFNSHLILVNSNFEYDGLIKHLLELKQTLHIGNIQVIDPKLYVQNNTTYWFSWIIYKQKFGQANMLSF